MLIARVFLADANLNREKGPAQLGCCARTPGLIATRLIYLVFNALKEIGLECQKKLRSLEV